jgi:hypothetical protein
VFDGEMNTQQIGQLTIIQMTTITLYQITRVIIHMVIPILNVFVAELKVVQKLCVINAGLLVYVVDIKTFLK